MRTQQFALHQAPLNWFDAIVAAPFGAVGVRLTENKTAVFELTYLPQGYSEILGDTPLARRVFEQISLYLQDSTHVFNLPLIEQGTPFQNKVWYEISQIPLGHTLNYKSVGQLLACGSPRAVGGACGANPYPLIVPCHRVVATHGMGGFARHDSGFHINVKRWLLAHEGVNY